MVFPYVSSREERGSRDLVIWQFSCIPPGMRHWIFGEHFCHLQVEAAWGMGLGLFLPHSFLENRQDLGVWASCVPLCHSWAGGLKGKGAERMANFTTSKDEGDINPSFNSWKEGCASGNKSLPCAGPRWYNQALSCSAFAKILKAVIFLLK